ncbi:hypothetical protein TIFTF001_030411 [Ficus carica]|uniref:Uncharacterized protein n=1 Tax=Ficus carica TaxID=3494 RepID=A0AA88J439_FICCA|nr:hypothetical protein TIFTF001_030346 [Ficus carica]GMN61312.1 hypothetical protein TIFTF001_030411 [Ficus carica]
MDEVCVFIKCNGQWDGTLRYFGGEMKGILVPETATYVGLIELVRSAIGIRGPTKTIVMRYGVEPGMPLVWIQCDADVKFYIQLKKKDVHVLSKFPITIDVFDESAVEAMPPEVGESNHIDVQRSREGVQSDEAMQHVDDSNLIILPPPPHIPSPTIGLDLHTEYGIEKQHQVLNNDLCTAHGNCNDGELNVLDDARQSNKNSIAACIGAHTITNNTTSQSVNVPSSDSVSGSVVVADYTPVTMRRNCIFENKKLLQYHLHHDAMSKHYQFKHEVTTQMAAYFHLHLVSFRHKAVNHGNANLVYSDAAFGICVQHLAANLKTRYKDFKGHLKTYFDGESRSYLLIHPIGKAEGCDVPEEVISQIVNPPNTKRGPGRPRVRRLLSQCKEHEPIRCGRCNGYEHN